MQTSDRHSSANLVPITSNTDLDRAPPAELARRLGCLVRQFRVSGSRDVAHQVAAHLDSLCFHPGLGREGHLRCRFLRLRAQWRWLARTLPEAAHV